MKKNLVLGLILLGFGAQTASAIDLKGFMQNLLNHKTATVLFAVPVMAGLWYKMVDEDAKEKNGDGCETDNSTCFAKGKTLFKETCKDHKKRCITAAVALVAGGLFVLNKAERGSFFANPATLFKK